MIIENVEEHVTDLVGSRKIVLDDLINKAHNIRDSFNHVRINRDVIRPAYPDINKNLIMMTEEGNPMQTDMTEYAFSQVCDLIGVPPRYMKKLYDQDLGELMLSNVFAQYDKKYETGRTLGHYTALVSNGVTEAVVSDKYSFGFQTPEVLETIRDYMPSNYTPNQAYLSNSRCHIRFVDFDNKVKVGGEDMSVGFTVGTSDIGKSSLTVKFFLYKFACRNGIVRIGKGGTLYKQVHAGDPFTEDNIRAFKNCFNDITYLRENSLDLIAKSQNRMMSEGEMQTILDTCKKSGISINDKEKAKIIDLAANRYGMTKWGLINGVTETAQEHTLDTRISYETFAGKILEKIA